MPAGGILGSLGLRSFSLAGSTQCTAPSRGTWGHTVSPLSITTPALPMTLPSTSAGASLLADQSASASAPGSSPKASDTIVVAPGVPALKRSLVELITERKFVDLGELPPAKGFGKTPSTLTSDMEGKIVLMQAAEYVQSKKHIPDLATWMQCFAIYSAVLLTKHPDRAQSLLMYSAIIACLSKKFRWPSWIIYDQYFRQEAADTGKTDWSKIDSSIHAQCFTGMSLCAEGWCSICTSMDHIKATCPYRSADDPQGPKRPMTKPSYRPPPKRARPQFKSDETCRKWNKYRYMDCPHGEACIYTHVCSICQANDHGALRCPLAKAPARPAK